MIYSAPKAEILVVETSDVILASATQCAHNYGNGGAFCVHCGEKNPDYKESPEDEF